MLLMDHEKECLRLEDASHDPICPAYATKWQNSSDSERTCHCDGLAKARAAARQHTVERDWRTGQGFTNGLTQQDIEYLQEEFESCERRVLYETCYALQAKVAHE